MVNKADEAANQQLCMYGTQDTYCGSPATWHVWEHAESGTMDCDAHVSWWNDKPILDKHPICGSCGLPNTVWIYSWEQPPGRCYVDGLDFSPSLAEVLRDPTNLSGLKTTVNSLQ